MLRTDEFRKKSKIEMDGQPWSMIDVEHVRPGKGQGFVRTKLKNLVTGQVVEKTFKSGDTMPSARIEDVEAQYLYGSGDEFTFMNTQNFEQISLTLEQLADNAHYLYEGLKVNIALYNGLPISCELPNFVELEITDCEPGIKGNSATNTMKPAVLSTGYRLQVPLFVDQNEWIRVDTRTGDYSERVKRPEGR
jgi:elongation factor P